MAWVIAHALAKRVERVEKKTSTLIVSAYNSTYKEKADYICDGVDDQDEIEKAISALPAAGGTVVLLEGEYRIGSSIRILRNNIELVGQGIGTVLRLQDGVNDHVITIGDGTAAYEKITIRNLKVDGNRPGQTATSHGIHIHNLADEVRLIGVEITNTYTDAISVDGGNNHFIQGCRIIDPGEDGIVLRQYVRDSIVLGNRLYGRGTAYGSGLLSKSNERISWVGNVVRNFRFGIEVNDEDVVATPRNLLFANNLIESVQVGIYNPPVGSGTEFCTFRGNIILSATYEGINLRWAWNCAVEGNVVQGAGSDGIRIEKNNCLISGNLCVGNGDNGIELAGALRTTVVGNRCLGNPGYGIAETGAADYNLVDGNNCVGNTTGAISTVGVNTVVGDNVA